MSTIESTSAPTTNGSTEVDQVAVENPATGELVGHVPNYGPEQIAELAARARAAQPAWHARGFDGRKELFDALRLWIVETRVRLAETLSKESGKTYEDAMFEFFFIAGATQYWAKNAEKLLKEEKIRSSSPLVFGRKIITRYEPRGVVGVIAPWNYPMVLGYGDALPALMAGNTVLLKPSGVTPLSTVQLIDEGMAAVGFPKDVCIAATGRGGTGTAIIDNVDMIQFTGSVEVGRTVAEQAGRRLIPASLELGGNDPMIVCADADIKRAAAVAVQHGMGNTGQTCMAVERVYVEEPVYDEFVERVTKTVKKLRQGAPGDPGSTDVGSMTGPGQADIVESQIRDAVAKGARVLAGGNRPGKGNFVEPTVLVDVDDTMECMREETFGPTLAIQKVRDAEEALREANNSQYGLNSSVWTKDTKKGEAIARRIEAGSACVNDALLNFAEFSVPFNGWKESGLGGRHGGDGIKKYCRTQTVLVTRWAPSKDPMQFPKSKINTKILERLMKTLYGRGGRQK